MATRRTRRGKSWMPWLLVGAGVLFLVGSTVARAVTQRISVQRVRARMKSLSLTYANVEILIDIHNTAGVSVPIDSFQGRLMYGGQSLADIHAPNPVVVNHNQTTTLTLVVPVQFTRLAENIVQLIESGQFIQALHVEGIIRSGGISVPVQKNLIAIV